MARSFIADFIRKYVDRPQYESDITRFMRDYLERHPEELESQRRGRATWWDKTPEERAPAPSMRHAPKAGGNEHTFMPSGGGAEHMFDPDDNAPPVTKPPVT